MKSNSLKFIGEEELISLSIGCTVLAGGGGGDPRIGPIISSKSSISMILMMTI